MAESYYTISLGNVSYTEVNKTTEAYVSFDLICNDDHRGSLTIKVASGSAGIATPGSMGKLVTQSIEELSSALGKWAKSVPSQ